MKYVCYFVKKAANHVHYTVYAIPCSHVHDETRVMERDLSLEKRLLKLNFYSKIDKNKEPGTQKPLIIDVKVIHSLTNICSISFVTTQQLNWE